jgi:SRSO17 transposase
LLYVVGIQSSTSVWAPGTAPLPPKRWRGRGRPTSLIRRDPKHNTNASGLRLIELPRRGADVIHHGEQQDVRHGRSGSASIGLQWI